MMMGTSISKPKKMKRMRSMKPFLSSQARKLEAEAGNRAKRTFEPSRGGRGTKLKIASDTLINTIIFKSPAKAMTISVAGKNVRARYISPKTTARARLLKGPAAAIIAPPFSGFLRLNGL